MSLMKWSAVGVAAVLATSAMGCSSDSSGSSATIGAPSKTGGEATVAHLSHGFLSSYVAEHTFVDYRATVSATNLAQTDYMVREQYLSTRP